MPRLRYYKDYSYEHDDYNANRHSDSEEQNNPDDFVETRSADDKTNFFPLSAPSIQNPQATSWLSQANVISNLSDTKLKFLISQYKDNLKLLETELSIRNSGYGLHINDDGDDTLRFSIGSLRYISKIGPKMGYGVITRRNPLDRKVIKFVRKMSLTSEQRSMLLREWEELLHATSSIR